MVLRQRSADMLTKLLQLSPEGTSVIDGDVYLRDGDSGIVYASERDASSGELVPVGRWVDGTLVPLAAAAPGWVSADGGERVIVHHF